MSIELCRERLTSNTLKGLLGRSERLDFANAVMDGLQFLAKNRPDFQCLPALIREQGSWLVDALAADDLITFQVCFEHLLRSESSLMCSLDERHVEMLDIATHALKVAAQKGDYWWMGVNVHAAIGTCLREPIATAGTQRGISGAPGAIARQPNQQGNLKYEAAPQVRVSSETSELVRRIQLPVSIQENVVRVGRHTAISFNRTLRIPEDGNLYPLPAGFGRLPIYRVEDYASRVPRKWLEEGGFFIPLYQREALYVEFSGVEWRPTIVKVGVGRVNAITGESFEERLMDYSQDYVVVPCQQWLDGINKGNGVVGQFVAMPLGQGYTVEEQITDEAKHGGFQILACDPKIGRFPDHDPRFTDKRENEFMVRHVKHPASYSQFPIDLPTEPVHKPSYAKPELPSVAVLEQWPSKTLEPESSPLCAAKRPSSVERSGLFAAPRRAIGDSLASPQRRPAESASLDMGIAAGGTIQQQIIIDPYGADSWEQRSATPLFIHIVNSEAFEAITGLPPPSTPITEYSYKKRGIPWFSNYDENRFSLPGAKAFKFLQTVMKIDHQRGISHANSELHGEIPREQVQRIHVPTIAERIAALQNQAQSSFNSQRYEAAIREATWLLDLLPDDPFALLMRANSYIRIKAYELADMDATAVIERNSKRADAFVVRAYANLSLGYFPIAISDARSAIRITPSSDYAKQLLNKALQSQGS